MKFKNPTLWLFSSFSHMVATDFPLPPFFIKHLFIVMDIHTINKGLDKFMGRVYGVDVYLTESSYKFGSKKYVINILFFPSKFLKGSTEYSEKYHNFFDRSQYEIDNDVFRALKYLGIDSNNIERDSIKFRISSDLPEYLKTYSEELVSNINNFIETETMDGISLSDKMSNVRITKIIPTVPYKDQHYNPHILLKLDYDNTSDGLMNSGFLNDSFVRYPMINYLKTKMDLDPQIDFWFE